MKRIMLTAAAMLLLGGATALAAGTSWRLVTPQGSAGTLCVQTAGGANVSYHRLDASRPARLRIRGPRRLKIVTRCLLLPASAGRISYEVRVALDGETRLRRTLSASPRSDVLPCNGGKRRIGTLRRTIISLPRGWHDVTVTAAAPAGVTVAARFLAEQRRRVSRWVSCVPTDYLEVTHLQFDSGRRSTYYLLDDAHPLRWQVTGPLTAEVWTRLDFPQSTSGTQPYGLEVRLDGKPMRTVHYHTAKLDAAQWVERPDVLPGQRKTLRLRIPRGAHRVEIRCLEPAAGCRIAAHIRIPEKAVR